MLEEAGGEFMALNVRTLDINQPSDDLICVLLF
jgi:hypothetical protein